MTDERSTDSDDQDRPECDLCGSSDCPDADLPGFSEPRDCAYSPIYNALRYDRCEYGCGRDVTKTTIRRDIVPVVARMTNPTARQGSEIEERHDQ